MADQDINMERFVYDVCMHVLEKFGLFKTADEVPKQNKYKDCDFLPSVSRGVLVNTILIRDQLKDALDFFYKRGRFNIEMILNILYEEQLKEGTFRDMDCSGKMGYFLAMCTEYIQFADTKNFPISLNEIFTGWNNFFEKNLRTDFEAKGGFTNVHSYFKATRVAGLDELLKYFISEYLLPYGAKSCKTEFLRRCSELPSCPLRFLQFGVVKVSTNISREQCETRDSKGSPGHDAGIKEPKQVVKDLDDASSTSRGKVGDSEMSQCGQSETSNSDISEDKLPEMSQDEGSSSTSTSKVDNSEMSQCGQGETSNFDISEDKLPEISQDEGSSSTSTSKVNNSEMSQCGQSETSNSGILQNKLLGIPPHEETPRGIDPFFVENIPSPPKPQENEPVASGDLPLSSDPEELRERVEEIISKLERDMEALRNLLFEHGLLSMKSGRRGSVRSKDGKGKKPPKGPEGLI